MASAKTAPRWLNPDCDRSDGGSGNAKLIDNIIKQAEIARGHADVFVRTYVEKTFKRDFEAIQSEYRERDYDWFVFNRNFLNETSRNPEVLEFKTTLVDVYAYLQQIAAGIDQSIVDDEKNDGGFAQNLNETLDRLCLVLCELQVAIVENKLEVREYQHRDLTNSNNTYIRVRNWIFYRNYLNILEYIDTVFNHFKENLPNTS